jgi:Dak1 domain
VAKALDGGAGVIFSYGNYAGDVLNFDAAQDRLRSEGVDCPTALVTDDIASAAADDKGRRRGVAGDLCVFKVASAAADRGDKIDEVERLARKANDLTYSFGVAFAGCTFPGRTEPLFTVEPGRMELGMGIHGEPGVRSVERLLARDLAVALAEPLLAERPRDADGRAAILLNGLGATKYEELFIIWKDVASALEGSRRPRRPARGRGARDEPGHGRLLADPVLARRRARAAVGSPRGHAGLSPGRGVAATDLRAAGGRDRRRGASAGARRGQPRVATGRRHGPRRPGRDAEPRC